MITKEEIQKLCELSRLNVSDSEQDKLRKDIEGILGYIGQIKSADFKSEVSVSFENVNHLRNDEIMNEPDFYTKDLINLAPRKEGRFIKTKKIL